eukprot:gene17232-20501_t
MEGAQPPEVLHSPSGASEAEVHVDLPADTSAADPSRRRRSQRSRRSWSNERVQGNPDMAEATVAAAPTRTPHEASPHACGRAQRSSPSPFAPEDSPDQPSAPLYDAPSSTSAPTRTKGAAPSPPLRAPAPPRSPVKEDAQISKAMPEADPPKLEGGGDAGILRPPQAALVRNDAGASARVARPPPAWQSQGRRPLTPISMQRRRLKQQMHALHDLTCQEMPFPEQGLPQPPWSTQAVAEAEAVAEERAWEAGRKARRNPRAQRLPSLQHGGYCPPWSSEALGDEPWGTPGRRSAAASGASANLAEDAGRVWRVTQRLSPRQRSRVHVAALRAGCAWRSEVLRRGLAGRRDLEWGAPASGDGAPLLASAPRREDGAPGGGPRDLDTAMGAPARAPLRTVAARRYRRMGIRLRAFARMVWLWRRGQESRWGAALLGLSGLPAAALSQFAPFLQSTAERQCEGRSGASREYKWGAPRRRSLSPPQAQGKKSLARGEQLPFARVLGTALVLAVLDRHHLVAPEFMQQQLRHASGYQWDLSWPWTPWTFDLLLAIAVELVAWPSWDPASQSVWNLLYLQEDGGKLSPSPQLAHAIYGQMAFAMQSFPSLHESFRALLANLSNEATAKLMNKVAFQLDKKCRKPDASLQLAWACACAMSKASLARCTCFETPFNDFSGFHLQRRQLMRHARSFAAANDSKAPTTDSSLDVATEITGQYHLLNKLLHQITQSESEASSATARFQKVLLAVWARHPWGVVQQADWTTRPYSAAQMLFSLTASWILMLGASAALHYYLFRGGWRPRLWSAALGALGLSVIPLLTRDPWRAAASPAKRAERSRPTEEWGRSRRWDMLLVDAVDRCAELAWTAHDRARFWWRTEWQQRDAWAVFQELEAKQTLQELRSPGVPVTRAERRLWRPGEMLLKWDWAFLCWNFAMMFLGFGLLMSYGVRIQNNS